MTIYHRHLDHAWQETRRQINYSLFGNSRGEMILKPFHRAAESKPLQPLSDSRSARWSSVYLREEQKRMYAQSYDERLFAISYWMWTEYSHQSLDERGHGHYLVGRDA